MSAWHVVQIDAPVRRFGSLEGKWLINEHVSFSPGTMLVLGMLKWLQHHSGARLMLPILEFDREMEDERRVRIRVATPAYGPVVDFHKEIRRAAMKRAPKQQPFFFRR